MKSYMNESFLQNQVEVFSAEESFDGCTSTTPSTQENRFAFRLGKLFLDQCSAQ